ncbi:MAG: formylglycine-generating enzyme family protein [Deltaproteobacteria bacterium]|nr:formylglycine-generating enzyme family protein [Deltaproteobacteria bacterium]
MATVILLVVSLTQTERADGISFWEEPPGAFLCGLVLGPKVVTVRSEVQGAEPQPVPERVATGVQKSPSSAHPSTWRPIVILFSLLVGLTFALLLLKKILRDSYRADDLWMDQITGIEFVWVNGGKFAMGCGSWTSSCEGHERPVHLAEVSGFWISKYPVTQGQWIQVMDSNPSLFKKGDNYPVERVSWDDTQEFINKFKTLTGTRYEIRLPTEAEWEYAARSGGRKQGYAGGRDVNRLAWYRRNSGKSTHPVGTKSPNDLGLHDMSGNVWEWCLDCYDKDFYGRPAALEKDPVCLENNTGYRIMRGGYWFSLAADVRCSHRGWGRPDGRDQDSGFRLVRIAR